MLLLECWYIYKCASSLPSLLLHCCSSTAQWGNHTLSATAPHSYWSDHHVVLYWLNLNSSDSSIKVNVIQIDLLHLITADLSPGISEHVSLLILKFFFPPSTYVIVQCLLVHCAANQPWCNPNLLTGLKTPADLLTAFQFSVFMQWSWAVTTWCVRHICVKGLTDFFPHRLQKAVVL